MEKNGVNVNMKERMPNIGEWYWLMRDKKTGEVFLSRHPRPDFVASYPDEGHIKLYWDRKLVKFKRNEFDFEAKKEE